MQTTRGTQPTISAFFQASPSATRKRTASTFPIDLTADSDDDEIPATKRPRLPGHKHTTPSAPAQYSAGSTSVADDWRFSSEKSKQATVKKIRTSSEKERHEAFKRKLLQDNNRFLKQESSTVQMNQDAMEVDESVASSEEESFNKLSDMFSHKDKGKGKARGKAAVKSPKKHVELGPSGQPYTPLELQVSVVKPRISSNSLGLIFFSKDFTVEEG
jgi:DNA mismatch repair protein MSH3